MNNLSNFPRAVKNQDVWQFEVAKSGVHLITITARCKNWLQNIGRRFKDDDLAIQIDDFLFAELGGKKYEFKSAGTWNGNKIKNAKKTVFFLLPLEAGAHEIKFWADGAPFVEKIEVELKTTKKLVITPQSENKYIDLVVKNISVDKAQVKSGAGKNKAYNFENSGRTGIFSLSLDCRKSAIKFIEFVLGAVKNKLGKIKLYKDLILSDEVNLRTEHNQESKIIARIPDGEEVEIITEKVLGGRVPSYTDIWHEIAWQGKRGYVLSSFVEIQGQERQTIIDFIKTKCLEYKADANIMLAIAGQESRFKPYAVSGSGPLGVFQLSKDAAKQVGVKIEERFNFFENIIGGIKYYQWIEKQYTGRGNVLERRLAAWHNGPGAVPKKGPIDYNKLGAEAEKFVKNVLENIKKKDWFHLASLALAIIFMISGPAVLSVDSLRKIDDSVRTLVAQAAPKENKTKFIFQDEFGVPIIIVKSVGDNGFNFKANLYYENKWGESRSEFLDGYLTNAGWIYLNYAITKLFWVERSMGHYLPTSFFIFDEDKGIFKKIKFLDRDGRTWDDISAPFDILSAHGESILRETVGGDYFIPEEIKKYKYDSQEDVFKEI